ncbi:hypothetical protein H9P43_000925 [Blastocladiella emersonii ATCC 22665]|nr:hypothetical protein H9P43_000925 [Blastocladiella emersonii ATCC 22665]
MPVATTPQRRAPTASSRLGAVHEDIVSSLAGYHGATTSAKGAAAPVMYRGAAALPLTNDLGLPPTNPFSSSNYPLEPVFEGQAPSPFDAPLEPLSGRDHGRSQSVQSVADTVASTSLDPDTTAWREVHPVLRDTVKQILIALQDNAATIDAHTRELESRPSSSALDRRLERLEGQFAALDQARREDAAAARSREQSLRDALAAAEGERDLLRRRLAASEAAAAAHAAQLAALHASAVSTSGELGNLRREIAKLDGTAPSPPSRPGSPDRTPTSPRKQSAANRETQSAPVQLDARAIDEVKAHVLGETKKLIAAELKDTRATADAAANTTSDAASAPWATRLDVELMLASRDDTWHDRLDSLSKHAKDMEETLCEMTDALAQLHAGMPERGAVAQLRGQLHLVQATLGEVREHAEREANQVAVDLTTVHNALAADVDRLQSTVRALRASVQDHAAERANAVKSLAAQLESKADSAALEELMRHVATREDMKKYLDKRLKHAGPTSPSKAEGRRAGKRRSKSGSHESMASPTAAAAGYYPAPHGMVASGPMMGLIDLEAKHMALQRAVLTRGAEQDDLVQRVQSIANKVGEVEANIAQLQVLVPNPRGFAAPSASPAPGLGHHHRGEARPRPLDSAANESTVLGGGSAGSPAVHLQPEDYEILHHKLTSAMDEKLFLLASEISTLRATFAGVQSHPWLRGGVWLWKSGSLKHGSGIPWSLEAQNTDRTNLRWEPDACVVRVAEAGVYELAFSFFTRSKPSIQIVINGESVMSAIHAPTYTVHHGSGVVTDGDGRAKEGSATGISLLDFVCLPAKSTVCLHWHGKIDHAVEGFMSLRRLT